MELVSATRASGKVGQQLMDAVQLDYQVTPFRGQRFYERYHKAIRRPLSYGATSVLFYRSEEDADHFVHMIFWEDRSMFDRWWFSDEMEQIRVSISGLHGQPLLPKWNTVLERR